MFVLLLYLPTNIYKTELFKLRNPYDTDLPVISDGLGAFVFLLFSFFFGLERGEWSFLLVVVVVVVGIIVRDV